MTDSQICIRGFRDDDATGISDLFREVYGSRYVYPEVYLPSVICRRNHGGSWLSAVVTLEERIVGHAALLLTPTPAPFRLAEIAMVVVSSAAAGRSIGVRVCRHLCEMARQSGVDMIMAMLVCSHRQSQRMARPLGFATNGLLFNYLPSSFANGQRESYVLSCLPLRPMPLPNITWPSHCPEWLSEMWSTYGVQTGTTPGGKHFDELPAMEIRSDGELVDITLRRLDRPLLDEACCLPSDRLKLVRLRVGDNLAAAAQLLQQAGLHHTGMLPATDGNWYWLMQGGFKAEGVALHNRQAQALFDAVHGLGRLGNKNAHL